MLEIKENNNVTIHHSCMPILPKKIENSRIVESDVTTMTYVFDVKTSMKAAKFEFRTSIDWNCAASLLSFNESRRNFKNNSFYNCHKIDLPAT